MQKRPRRRAAHLNWRMTFPRSDAERWDAHAQTLHRVALAAARPSGPTLFDDLVREMTESLGAAAGLVAVFTDDTQTRVRTVASRLDGRPLPGFEYDLAGTPCEQVVGTEFRHVSAGMAAQFSGSSLFASKGMDSYSAFPLCDSHGDRVGLLAAMGRAPFADIALAEAVLKIVGSRIVGDLTRATGRPLRAADSVRVALPAYLSCDRGDGYQVPEVQDLCHNRNSAPRAVDLLRTYLVDSLHRTVTPPPPGRINRR